MRPTLRNKAKQARHPPTPQDSCHKDNKKARKTIHKTKSRRIEAQKDKQTKEDHTRTHCSSWRHDECSIRDLYLLHTRPGALQPRLLPPSYFWSTEVPFAPSVGPPPFIPSVAVPSTPHVAPLVPIPLGTTHGGCAALPTQLRALHCLLCSLPINNNVRSISVQ